MTKNYNFSKQSANNQGKNPWILNFGHKNKTANSQNREYQTANSEGRLYYLNSCWTFVTIDFITIAFTNKSLELSLSFLETKVLLYDCSWSTIKSFKIHYFSQSLYYNIQIKKQRIQLLNLISLNRFTRNNNKSCPRTLNQNRV